MSEELIYKTTELGLCLFEGYLYYIYWNHFLQARFLEKWKTALCIGTAELGIFAVNSLRIPSANLMAEILLHMAAVCFLYNGKIGKKIFLTAIICFIMVASEFLIISFADMTLGNRTIYFTYDAGKACFVTFVIKIFTYLLIRLICAFWKNENGDETVKIPFCFYLSPVASIFIFIGMAYSDIQFTRLSRNSAFIVLGSLLLFASNILLLELYNRTMRAMETMRKYDILHKENTLKSDYYEQLEEINEQVHNMTHYVGTIRELALQGRGADIVEIIDGWTGTVSDIAEEKYSCDTVINAVLREKKTAAEKKRVELTIFAEPGFTVTGVKSVDLIGIFSNVIENALEAAEKCENGYVHIRLFRVNDGYLSVIRVDNNFKVAPVMRDGQFITSKEDKRHHGIGIKYINKMVEEYGGYCRFAVNENRFTAIIMLAC